MCLWQEICCLAKHGLRADCAKAKRKPNERVYIQTFTNTKYETTIKRTITNQRKNIATISRHNQFTKCKMQNGNDSRNRYEFKETSKVSQQIKSKMQFNLIQKGGRTSPDRCVTVWGDQQTTFISNLIIHSFTSLCAYFGYLWLCATHKNQTQKRNSDNFII